MVRVLVLLGWIALTFVVTGTQVQAQTSAPRLALVVGNAGYAEGRLPTAVNDAGLVARALSQAGFSVTAAADLDRARLDALFESFVVQVKAAGPEATAFVYLAGYGAQFSNDVYVLPIGTKLARDDDVPRQAVSASDFRRKLETLPARARVFVYDLARENPFVRDGMRLAGGLPMLDPAKATMLAFNAAPGTVAPQDVTPYGAYARALAEMILTTGAPLPTLFERVRLRVSNLTAGATSPWNAGSALESTALTAESAPPELRATDADATGADMSASDRAYVAALARDALEGYAEYLKLFPAEPLAARVRTVVAARREAMLWSETVRLDADRAYWTYMRRYPRGPHLSDARRRLLSLGAPLDPPPRFDIVTYTSAPLPQPSELSLIDRPVVTLDDTAWPAAPTSADLLASSPVAFHRDLPPPPLVLDGTVPIADPIPVKGREGNAAISQPMVLSGQAETWETHFEANGGWTVSVLTGAAARQRIVMTPGQNGDRTIVQSGPDGAVIARTTIVHEGSTTAIVQTGPSGGILTRTVTRVDPDGGHTTVTSTGGNQVISTTRTDARGVTSIKRGPAGELGTWAQRPTRPALAIPPDPPAPLPLTMPQSSLPSPIPPPSTGTESKASQAPDGKAAASKTSDAKADAKDPSAKAPDETTAPVNDPNGRFPATGPLPPRRAVPANKGGASAHGRGTSHAQRRAH